MNDLETIMAAVRALDAIDKSVLRVMGMFDRNTRIGEYLRALWLVMNALTRSGDTATTIGYECEKLDRAQKKLIDALEVDDA